MVFSYGYEQQHNRINDYKKYREISGRFDDHADAAVCNAQWSTSSASLEATGCRHWASACAVSPRWSPWSNLLKHYQNTTFS